MARTQSAQVSINPVTLNALVALVCDKEGVNLSPIIDDLSNGLDVDRAVVAANTVIAFKGIKVEVDSATRYCSGGQDNYRIWEFIAYSAILDRVTYKATYVKLKEGKWEKGNSYEDTCAYDDWASRSTKCPISETNEE